LSGWVSAARTAKVGCRGDGADFLEVGFAGLVGDGADFLAAGFFAEADDLDVGDLDLRADRAKCWRVLELCEAWDLACLVAVWARLGLGATEGDSRVTSSGDLSSRRPRKAAWRTRLSEVQVAKRT